jgi:hypothetical protein
MKIFGGWTPEGKALQAEIDKLRASLPALWKEQDRKRRAGLMTWDQMTEEANAVGAKLKAMCAEVDRLRSKK